MILFLLLLRVSPRVRAIAASLLVAAGLVLIVISAAVAAGLLIHGIVAIAVGAVLFASVVVSRRRARLARQQGIDCDMTPAGHAGGR